MGFLALRHLLARKKQTFFIWLGICLGAMTYIVIAGMQLGFQTFMTDQLITTTQ